MRVLARLLIVLGVPVVLVTGCGSSKTTDKTVINAILNDIQRHPETLCTQHSTAAFVKQAGGLRTCVKHAKSPASAPGPADKVLQITITGSTATAKVSRGGTSIELDSLVKQKDSWKISSLEPA